MHKNWILILFAAILLSSCSIMQAVALKDCTYTYNRITDVTFMNLKQSDIVSFSGITRVTKALISKNEEMPLGFTVHVRVSNPNKKTASVDRIFYVVDLDTIQVASGCTTEPLIVAGESTIDMPLRFVFDVKTMLNSGASPTLGNLVKNFIGIGDTATNVTLHLKPVVKVGSASMSIPKPIALHFAYGGKQNK